MKKIITSNSGYNYIYSSYMNSFLLTPFSEAKDKIVNLNTNKEEVSYCEKKMIFLKEHGILDDNILPIMDIEYDSSCIESNLANLNQLLIEVTDECNLACKYCSYGELYGNYDVREGKKQSFNNVKILIDFLYDLWKSYKNISFDNVINIGFYGGEPLMNITLIQQIIDYLESLELNGFKFVYNLTTNAVLLSKYIDYLVEKEIHLLISLDGSKENNVYRTAKDGREVFDVIYSNIICLKDKYPDYFDKYVNFNAVLHNRNTLVGIYEYIKDNFDKVPHVSELNRNGVDIEKNEKFNQMYVKKSDSIKQTLNCESININDVIVDTKITQLNIFMMSYSGNIYKTIPDLFFLNEKLRYYPTSTCTPFSRKIFLTVNGKIMPCEKIGQQYPLGRITNGTVCLDTKEIKDFYACLYKPIVDKCKHCLLWKTCEICVFFLPKDENDKVICPYFCGETEISNYFASYLSVLESQPDLQDKIANEIIID